MYDHKDIADLLEEVQTIVHGLRDEKSDLNDQVLRLEAQLSLVKEEKTKEGGNLEQINAQLKQELQETKDRLTRELQENEEFGLPESLKKQRLSFLMNYKSSNKNSIAFILNYKASKMRFRMWNCRTIYCR